MKRYLGVLGFLSALLTGWAGTGVVQAEGLNDRFASELQGKALNEERVVVGMTLPLNSVVVGPSFEQSDRSDPIAIITFRRSDLTREFIVRFFDPMNRDIRRLHPFAARGIEAVLAPNELFVILHRGVALHLRSDVSQFPGFRTFRTDDAVGTVTLVTGDFLASRDQATIQEKLAHVWTEAFGPRFRCPGSNCVRGKDGSYSGWGDSTDFPPYFPPRIGE